MFIKNEKELNACYDALRRLQEAEVVLRCASTVAARLMPDDESGWDNADLIRRLHDGMGEIRSRVGQYQRAIEEWLMADFGYVNTTASLALERTLEICRRAEPEQPGPTHGPSEHWDRYPSGPVEGVDCVQARAVDGGGGWLLNAKLTAEDVGNAVCLTLHGFGQKKIAVIKAVRWHLMGLGLRQAKIFVESGSGTLPAVVTNLPEHIGNKLCDEINRVGGQAEVHGPSETDYINGIIRERARRELAAP